MRSLGLQSHGRCDGGYIVLAAWRAGAAARIFHRILMKQQNPIENQYVGGKCHRPLYIW